MHTPTPSPAPAGRRISVVLTTTRPWPEAAGALRSVYAQAVAHDGEVILADATGLALPARHEMRELRHLVLPNANVFRLRSAGLAAARGAVVALTEDHCTVAPDWVVAVLRAHAEHPTAGVIGGAVLNGARERLVDWANFFVSNEASLPPMRVRAGPDITGQANVSYKRDLLARYPDDALDEGRFRRALVRDGVPLVADDRIVVSHIQSLSVRESLTIHFHDGRCVAAAHRARSTTREQAAAVVKGLAWGLRVPLAAARIVARTLADRPAYRCTALACAPWMLSLVAFHKAGELVGALAGAGRSPDHMR